MNKPHEPASATNAALLRAQAFMTPSPVPSISTELLVTADGELNRELHHFLFDPPSNPELLKGKKIAICCTNGVEEVEIIGAMKWLTEHGATVHVVAPRIGEFHPTLGLRFPPLTKTHVLAIRLMENAGWLKIDCYMDEAKVADYDACIFPGGCWNPDCAARRQGCAEIRAGHAGLRQAHLRHLPWPVGDGECRHPQGQEGHRRVEHPPRPRQCRRHRAGRALRGRRQPDHRPLPL